LEQLDDVDMDKYLDAISAAADGEDKTNTASHVITVRMIDSEEEVSIDSAADVNNLLLKYALTVHKSQGSEWQRVFLILHQSHNTMLQRELLYTAVTRAASELYVICEPDAFRKGVQSQKIKGTTLEEKLEYFKGTKNA
jgi:exodeoxyribonuclease V alpha subunit